MQTLNNVYIRVDIVSPDDEKWLKYRETIAAFKDDAEDTTVIAFVPNQIYSGYIKGTLKEECQSPDDSPSQPVTGWA